MTAKQLIKRLREIVAKYGDLPVHHRDAFIQSKSEVTSLSVYTAEGHLPDLRRKDRQPAEIYLA